MTLEALSKSELESIVYYWCDGATEAEISDWLYCDRPTVVTALTKVTMANCLHSPTDLLDYDPDGLVEAYDRYAQEVSAKPDDDRMGQSQEGQYGNSYKRLEESSRKFLALLELHHGNGMRATG